MKKYEVLGIVDSYFVIMMEVSFRVKLRVKVEGKDRS